MPQEAIQIVGILEQDGRNGRVVPDGKATDIRVVTILPDKLNGAPFGMRVVVQLISSPDSPDPLGEVVEVLGDPARPDVAMEGIIRMYGLSETFPKDVQAQADKLPTDLSQADIDKELRLGRRDLRNLRTVTIDGVDAKDLDDAISIQKDQDGSYTLYVHIADVAHYVTAGSAIDQEALERGNSVYLADRVIPMLPPKLSNSICSINPGAERLTLTCMLQYDSSGTLIDGDIYESIIVSDLRADYESVRISLEEEVVPGYEGFMSEFNMMADLAKMLDRESVRRGALQFEFPETHVEVDKDGLVVDIRASEISFSNEIIEQFMVAANSFVAEKFTQMELPFIYRIHDTPDTEKLQKFRDVLKIVGGIHDRIPESPTPRDISRIIENLKEVRGGKTLETLLLRSLAKAIYSDNPIGHFGLALDDYSHFTAPIRRYSDLFIHRVIKGFLRRNMKVKEWTVQAPEVSDHVSATERTAILAERASVDQKVAEYYADRIGEVYTGEITGFVGAGMFVMLPSTAEGMIPFRTMDDYYIYDELTMTAQGRDKKRLFTMGDKVEVQIARADVIRRQIDLVLVDEQASGRIDREFAQQKDKRRRANQQGGNKSGSRNRSGSRNKSGGSRRRNKSSGGGKGGYKGGSKDGNKSRNSRGRSKKSNNRKRK